jgi:hypothetical protein
MKLHLTLTGNTFLVESDDADDFNRPLLRAALDAWLTALGSAPLPGPAVVLALRPFRLVDGPEGAFRTMIRLTSTQKVGYALDAQDARGNPAAIDGAPSWESSVVVKFEGFRPESENAGTPAGSRSHVPAHHCTTEPQSLVVCGRTRRVPKYSAA